MTFKSIISPLIKYWWLLVAASFVSGITSFIVTSFQPPIYQTTSTLMVGRAIFEANPSSSDLYLGQQLASYYADFGTLSEVRQATMQALGINFLPDYSVLPVPNSQLIEITVVDTFPARAQAVANELANQLIKHSPTSNQTDGAERQQFIQEQIAYLEEKITETLNELEKAEKNLSEMNSAREIADARTEITALQTKLSQLQTNYTALLANTEQGASNILTIIEPAGLPSRPIGPNVLMVTVLSGLVALSLAAAAAYLLEFLDDTLKTADDVHQLLGANVLASIPVMRQHDIEKNKQTQGRLMKVMERLNLAHLFKQNKPVDPDTETNTFLYSLVHPRSRVADEFRSLRVNLDFAAIDISVRSILVTSPDASEGKTSVASNLALVMAQGGKKVILVDTDFRRPSVDQHFNIPNVTGLSDIFLGDRSASDVIQHSAQESLYVITTGIIPPNPGDVLSSHKIDQILVDLKNLADVVIIDGPPLFFPDALALATKVDSVLLVVRHAVTRKNNAQFRVQQLGRVGARLAGVVLNGIPGKSMSHYGSYEDYYKKVESKS